MSKAEETNEFLKSITDKAYEGIGGNKEYVPGTGLTGRNYSTWGNYNVEGSYFSDVEKKIIEMLEDGYESPYIAETLSIPEEVVDRTIIDYENKTKFHK